MHIVNHIHSLKPLNYNSLPLLNHQIIVSNVNCLICFGSTIIYLHFRDAEKIKQLENEVKRLKNGQGTQREAIESQSSNG